MMAAQTRGAARRDAAAHARLTRARQLQGSGRIDQAEQEFKAIIAASPDFAPGHHYYGLLLADTGRPADAIDQFKLTILHDRNDTAAMVNLATALQALGRDDEAAQCYRAVLARNPDRADAWRGLGVVHLARNDNVQAASLLREALRRAPNDPIALCNFGIAGLRLGHIDAGYVALSQALDEAPAQFKLLCQIGDLMLAAELDAHAARAYERALALQPDSTHVAINLAAALSGLGQHRRAADLLEPVMARMPDRADGWVKLCLARRGLGDADGAEAACRRVLALQPNSRWGHAQTALLLQDRGLPREALATLEAWASANPFDAEIDHFIALVRLLLGDFEIGWAKLESRVLKGHRRRSAPAGTPVWAGEDIAGRTILVEAEEGYGDTIQFCRYAADLAARGARVALAAPGPLCRLLATVPGVDAVHDVALGEVKADLSVPIMSLPLRFGTRADTIPARVPYMSVAADDVARWRAKLQSAGRPAIGLVWAGNPNHRNDFMRSIPWAVLAPLLDCRAASWHSLQVGPAAMADDPRLADLAADLADYYETAAAICALDLVITVDTSVAHLAGALGRPVWTLLASAPDWRWQLGRADTPWYPTMRLFRQAARGDWAPVIAAVIDALERKEGLLF